MAKPFRLKGLIGIKGLGFRGKENGDYCSGFRVEGLGSRAWDNRKENGNYYLGFRV